MGTTYTVLDRDNLTIQLDEKSNMFSLDLEGKTETRTIRAYDASDDDLLRDAKGDVSVYTGTVLTVEDLVVIALHILTVASYWSDDLPAIVERVCVDYSRQGVDVPGLQHALSPLFE